MHSLWTKNDGHKFGEAAGMEWTSEVFAISLAKT